MLRKIRNNFKKNRKSFVPKKTTSTSTAPVTAPAPAPVSMTAPAQPNTIVITSNSIRDILQLFFRNEDLSEICRNLKIKVSGIRVDLIERIVKRIESLAHPQHAVLPAMPLPTQIKIETNDEQPKTPTAAVISVSNGGDGVSVRRLIFRCMSFIFPKFPWLIQIVVLSIILLKIFFRGGEEFVITRK